MLQFSKTCHHPHFQNSEFSVASIGPIPQLRAYTIICIANEIKLRQ